MTNKFEFPKIISSLPKADIPLKGLEAYLLQGDNQQIVFMSFEQEVNMPEHTHNAQAGVVLSGEIELTVNNKTTTYKKGDTYFIPANAPHSAKIKKGYADITLFDQKDRFKKL